MKKGIMFLILLISINLALATININVDKDRYNIGNNLIVSGSISEDSKISGLFKLQLSCDEDIQRLSTISLNVNEVKNFNEVLSLTTSPSDECSVRAMVEENGGVVESVNSGNFQITKELVGSFNIEEKRIQLGKKVLITGNVYEVDGTIGINGIAIFYFKQNNNNSLVVASDVKGGVLRYEKEVSGIPSGDYKIDIVVRDAYGNEQLFEDAVDFTLVSELYVFAKADKSDLFPGETVNIFGEAKTILQEKVESAKVNVDLEENNYEVDMKDSKFDKKIVLPTNIKTGKHKIMVTAEDSLGNKGLTDINIYIKAVPSRISYDFSKLVYRPGEQIIVKPILYDQADDVLVDNLMLEVYGPDNEKLFSGVVKSNERRTIDLPIFSKPGKYRVVSSIKDINLEEAVDVESIANIDILLDNQTLLITNVGNVKYTDSIEVNLGRYSFSKRSSLYPNETMDIELGERVPTGVYNIIVTSGKIKEEFKDISIIGKPVTSFKPYYIILLIIVVALLIYLSRFKRKTIHKERRRDDKEKEKAKKIGKKLREEKKEKKPYRFSFGKATAKDTEDFKKRVLKDIEAAQKKQKDMMESKRGSLEPEKSSDSDKGLFNMFD